jgi:hypothetical protein
MATNTDRKAFIKSMLRRGHEGMKLKYIGEVHQQELLEAGSEFYESRVKGDEICKEFHKFEIVTGRLKGVPLVCQWRLRPEPSY